MIACHILCRFRHLQTCVCPKEARRDIDQVGTDFPTLIMNLERAGKICTCSNTSWEPQNVISISRRKICTLGALLCRPCSFYKYILLAWDIIVNFVELCFRFGESRSWLTWFIVLTLGSIRMASARMVTLISGQKCGLTFFEGDL